MVPVGEGAGVGGILSEFLTAPAPHASGAEGSGVSPPVPISCGAVSEAGREAMCCDGGG